MTKDMKKRTIYPADWPLQVIGSKAGDLNRGLSVLAAAVVEAMDRLAQRIRAKDWATLLQVLHGQPFEEHLDRPCEKLAARIHLAAADMRAGQAAHLRDALAPLVERLSTLEGYALMLLINSVLNTAAPPENWWQPAAFRLLASGRSV